MVAKFWLDPVQLEKPGGLKAQELHRIGKLVQQHQTCLRSDGLNTLAHDLQLARAQTVSVTEEMLVIDLKDGRSIRVPLVWYPRLWYGHQREREHVEIIGDGEYLHWPDLDEDLSVSGILAGRRSAESPESLKR